MNIWNSIRNKWQEEIIIKSIIWNSIIEIFKKEKSLDITRYLISIIIRWKTVIIKTNKPIINTELLTIDDKIKKASWEKLLKIWIKFYDFDIRYS